MCSAIDLALVGLRYRKSGTNFPDAGFSLTIPFNGILESTVRLYNKSAETLNLGLILKTCNPYTDHFFGKSRNIPFL
jgi:hypothetical protein